MSDLGLELDHEHRHKRQRRRRSAYGCLAVLVAVAVLAGGAYYLFSVGVDALQDRFSSPEDYTGPGTGSVVVEVEEGDNASDIAETLVDEDVVKSEEAFTEAAIANPDSRGIQVGFYEMQRQMPAADALEILVDPANMVQAAVTFPEGWTADQIVAHLAKSTDFSAKQYTKVLARPERIGLPSYAGGDAEGFLFPATSQIKPDATPRSILTMMVDRYLQAAENVGLKEGAAELGLTPHEVMTVASLIQAEARFDKDFAKVSRVIYNRLDEPMPLQFDSTVHYAVGRDGNVGTSDEDRNIDSPYNTYRYAGLPPGPIMTAGEKAMRAALNPADGPWLYFVTTNPDTGETKFAESFSEHQQNVAEFQAWCSQSDNC